MELIRKARQGQEDMQNVQSNMARISGSMTEMNEVVSVTGRTFEDIFSSLGRAEQTVADMLKKMDAVNEIATSVAAIAEEQSASTEEVTATVDTAAASAQHVASESRDVDSSAETVADSAARIGGFVGSFRI